MLVTTAREVAVVSAVASASQPQGFLTIKLSRNTRLNDGAGVVEVIDVFVEGNRNAPDSVDNLHQCAPVNVSVILNVYTQNFRDGFGESRCASRVVGAIVAVAAVNFVDFIAGVAGAGNLEITRQTNHGDITGSLMEANQHNSVGELGTIVTRTAHVVTAGTDNQYIGAAIFVSFEVYIIVNQGGENIAQP